MIILVKAVAGSHLFGTNTEKSDKDYKGVYIPSEEDILLGNSSNTITHTTGSSNSRNCKEDIDVELYPIKKFLQMVVDGDTAAIELLNTPDHLIVEKHLLWDSLKRDCKPLLNSNVKSIIGYARSQVNKYGVRGSRMADLKTFMTFLKQLDKQRPHTKLKCSWDDITYFTQNAKFEHIRFTTLKNNIKAIDILGKFYDEHAKLEYVCKKLSNMYDEYGNRSKEAMENKGIDFKAVSHALRVSLQALEFLDTGKITLPHTGANLEEIMKYKLGNVSFSEFNDRLNDLLQEVENKSRSSILSSEMNNDLKNKLIVEYHKIVIDK